MFTSYRLLILITIDLYIWVLSMMLTDRNVFILPRYIMIALYLEKKNDIRMRLKSNAPINLLYYDSS